MAMPITFGRPKVRLRRSLPRLQDDDEMKNVGKVIAGCGDFNENIKIDT